MRTAAQAEMVLDENSEAEVVISYLSDLMQQAQTQQTEQERIVYHQSFLNLPKMVNDDLALAQEEVSCPCCLFVNTPWLRTLDHRVSTDHTVCGTMLCSYHLCNSHWHGKCVQIGNA